MSVLGSSPLSVKGICVRDGWVVLLRNDRREWELPGGRPEPGEDREGALRREILEELGLSAEVGALVDTWWYRPVTHGAAIEIVTFACVVRDWRPLAISSEHAAVEMFALTELDRIALPSGYRTSIGRALELGLIPS